MKKRLYVAYGSNLNIQQMKYRCPTAKLYGTGTIENYELQFKGYPNSAFATIAPKTGTAVPVAVWEIRPEDELALDRYEGYPSHYFKQDVPVQLDGGEVTAMVYVMNLKKQFGLPSTDYYQTVYEGYNDCKLDTDVLEQAVKESARRVYDAVAGSSAARRLLDYEDGDCTEEEAEEPDEDGPFHFSDGLQM